MKKCIILAVVATMGAAGSSAAVAQGTKAEAAPAVHRCRPLRHTRGATAQRKGNSFFESVSKTLARPSAGLTPQKVRILIQIAAACTPVPRPTAPGVQRHVPC